MSKEDLNHIDGPIAYCPSPTPHPKDLVALHPVPPKPENTPPPNSRRSSGNSVKDLVRDFEMLEGEKSKERERISQMVINGRRSSGSLTQKKSNLSTCSPITAEWDMSAEEQTPVLSTVAVPNPDPCTPVNTATNSHRRTFSWTRSFRPTGWFT